MIKSFPSPRILAWAGFIAALGATAGIYWQARNSGLFVDDYYNLHLLPMVSTQGLAAFVFSGIAGPAGRPLSMLSFALQYRSWPDHLEAFKLVNLAIHLGCGVLLFVVCRRLADFMSMPPGRAALVSTAAASLWLLHPMQLSTVLYTIQRMTELSALFVLLGLWGVLAGRRLCARRLRAGYLLMSISLVLGTVLAVLSKENGALLPLLVLVLDGTLLLDVPRPPGYAWWRRIFLLLPTAIIGLYLAWAARTFFSLYPGRPYSMYEKTLTEARVLLDYARDLLLPRLGAYGFIHDDMGISRGLLDPPATLFSVLAIAVLLAAALRYRRRFPVAAFAVLWFLCGHLLESTHLDLAIYFEHRNYLPSAGVCFALGCAVPAAAQRIQWRGAVYAGTGLYLLLAAWISLQNAVLWSDPMGMALEAVRKHPDSAEAMVRLGNQLVAAGNAPGALGLFRDMADHFPGETYPLIKQMAIKGCVMNESMPDPWWRALVEKARDAEYPQIDVLTELAITVSAVTADECKAINDVSLLTLLEMLAGNPHFHRESGALYELAAHLSLHHADLPLARSLLDAAVKVSPTLNRQMERAELLVAMKQFTAAHSALAALEHSLNMQPEAILAYHDRVQRLKERLAAAR